MSETPEMRTVTIPSCSEHGGHQLNTVEVTLKWVCPTCGGPRGEIYHGNRSYDGRFWMYVDGWLNPCGHIDAYRDVRGEWIASQKEAVNA